MQRGLSAIAEYLFASCYRGEVIRANIDRKSAISLQQGQLDPKFQVEVVAPPTIIFPRKLG